MVCYLQELSACNSTRPPSLPSPSYDTYTWWVCLFCLLRVHSPHISHLSTCREKKPEAVQIKQIIIIMMIMIVQKYAHESGNGLSFSVSLFCFFFSPLTLFLLQYACDRNVSINVRNVMQCVCLSSFVIINFRIFCARCRCQRQGCLKHLSYIFIVCCFAIVIYTVFLVILLLLLLWHDGVRRKWERERKKWLCARPNSCELKCV